ncbi:DUF3592 domain-containing protein [Flavobacterium gelatinilyticum]|uniref:DUF3592 domain-containing protein n=1 Tax=Flavobacterium gelatinilyticum TaxID=3003260 RepID=UPI00247FD714|nr:DUF3592 domain-containing protein [Flavobacterium gelatinilyticum]
MVTNNIDKDKLKAYGCLGLFFLPFVAVGIWTLYKSVCNVYNSQKTDDWKKVTALVDKIDIEYHSDSDGGETSEVIIQYKYAIHNVNYTGTKIAYGYGNSNVEEHSQLFYKLEKAKKIAVFVNPDDYSEAVIIRGMNSSIVFLLVFSIIWNSLISFFLLPLLMKKNSKFNIKKYFLVVIVIWIVGFTILLSNKFDIGFTEKVEVIEHKIE